MGQVIKYNVAVYLPMPVEIPAKIQQEAARLFSDHLRKYCEQEYSSRRIFPEGVLKKGSPGKR